MHLLSLLFRLQIQQAGALGFQHFTAPLPVQHTALTISTGSRLRPASASEAINALDRWKHFFDTVAT